MLLSVSAGASPDVVLVGEHDDGACVGRLQQTQDDLVELSGSRLTRNLQRLSDANSTWKQDKEAECAEGQT